MWNLQCVGHSGRNYPFKEPIFRQVDKLLKIAIHTFLPYCVAKFFNFTLINCAFFCFLTASKILVTTELDHSTCSKINLNETSLLQPFHKTQFN